MDSTRAVMIVGLAATLAVTILITRKARAALAEVEEAAAEAGEEEEDRA